jgi:hypothetical protein
VARAVLSVLIGPDGPTHARALYKAAIEAPGLRPQLEASPLFHFVGILLELVQVWGAPCVNSGHSYRHRPSVRTSGRVVALGLGRNPFCRVLSVIPRSNRPTAECAAAVASGDDTAPAGDHDDPDDADDAPRSSVTSSRRRRPSSSWPGSTRPRCGGTPR